MRAVVALVRAPLFSVRKPLTYQAAAAFPLPQPSTLVGALACSLAVTYGGVEGVKGDVYVKECCKLVLRELVRATVKPLTPVARSSLTLSRMRTLELGSDKVVRRIERGGRIRDAMIREYFYGRLGLLYVFRDGELASKAVKALYLLERLGDTESCVSVDEVGEGELEPLGEEGVVDTYTPADWVRTVRGAFSLDSMCPEEVAAIVIRKREDIMRRLVKYVLPLREIRENLFAPSPYRVGVREGFSLWSVKLDDVRINVVLPQGGGVERLQ
ncbi:MAG: type I-A CRISPR-associated protein Cas5 [Thermoprotei archaeon]|nr:MAG: type I-A CRISPR-associated protein Cas5 [Thermoprotei archaeon]